MTAGGMNLLPCGHIPELDDDHYILDRCFECGWRSEYRIASDRLNELSIERAELETQLIQAVRAGNYTPRIIDGLCNRIYFAHMRTESQRRACKRISKRTAEEIHDGNPA